ncbi:hypothetical protein D3C76_681640 [compost metagenome]
MRVLLILVGQPQFIDRAGEAILLGLQAFQQGCGGCVCVCDGAVQPAGLGLRVGADIQQVDLLGAQVVAHALGQPQAPLLARLVAE